MYQVEAQASLALGVEHDEVHYADCGPGERPLACAPTSPFQLAMKRRTRQHILIPRQDLLVAHVRWIPLFVHDYAVGIHDSVGGDRRACGRPLEGHAGCEFAVDRAREVHTKLPSA